MSSGHTDRATINARRPLSPGMRRLLSWIVTKGPVAMAGFSEAEKNQARALMDRGYITPDEASTVWHATDAGRAEAAKD